MNPAQTSRKDGAFTLIEMLCVIAIIAILFALLMPAVARTKNRAKKIQCIGGLSEVGRAFYLFANDHGGKFTTQVPTNQGGALEFVTKGYQMRERYYFSYQLVRPLSGEIVTPKLFACPADLERWQATNFSDFNNHNFSYAIGLQASPSLPGAILAADRNLPACPKPYYWEIMEVPNPRNKTPHWNKKLHQWKGNILFADAHVEESTDAKVVAQKTVPEDLMYPDVEGTRSPSFDDSGTSPGGTIIYAPASPLPVIARSNSPTLPPVQTATASSQSARANSSGPTRVQNQVSSGPRMLARVQNGGDSSVDKNQSSSNEVAVSVTPPMTPSPAVAVAETNEPTLANQFGPAMMESLEASSWLLWLLLLLLLLILLSRWLDRKLRRRSRRAKA